jgi:hypothetical protein
MNQFVTEATIMTLRNDGPLEQGSIERAEEAIEKYMHRRAEFEQKLKDTTSSLTLLRSKPLEHDERLVAKAYDDELRLEREMEITKRLIASADLAIDNEKDSLKRMKYRQRSARLQRRCAALCAAFEKYDYHVGELAKMCAGYKLLGEEIFQFNNEKQRAGLTADEAFLLPQAKHLGDVNLITRAGLGAWPVDWKHWSSAALDLPD